MQEALFTVSNATSTRFSAKNIMDINSDALSTKVVSLINFRYTEKIAPVGDHKLRDHREMDVLKAKRQ